MKLRNNLFLLVVAVVFAISCSKDSPTPTPPSPPNPPVQAIPNTQAPQSKGTTYTWNKDIFYEIFVRSFYDSNGDGIGDINGIIQKLDYIQKDLGATAIWLMPINPSPSYHGYDVTNYRGINPEYGTMQDFKNLVQEVHKRGMKIIIDLVINHTSNNHAWFQNAWSNKSSTYRDWYIFKDTKPNYSSPWGSNVWHGNNTNGYYYGIFSHVMPDLNFKSKAVKDEIKTISDFWLTTISVDGFRLDAAKHIIEEGQNQENTAATITYWNEFANNIKAANSNAMTVAEVWTSTNEIVKYINNGLDLAFEFDVAEAIKNAVKSGNPSNLKSKIAVIRDIYPYHQYATFLSNHDQDRSYEVMGKSIPNAKLAASILLTLPATPFIYYGEEIGMWGTKAGGDEWVRTPLHWTNNSITAGFTNGSSPWWKIIGDEATKNITTQKADENSLLSTYKKFIKLRKEHPQLTIGTFQNLGNKSASLYSYLRESENKAIIVVHNFSNATINSNVYGSKTNLTKGTYIVTDILSNKPLADITLNSNGGFMFDINTIIKSKETKLLLIKKK